MKSVHNVSFILQASCRTHMVASAKGKWWKIKIKINNAKETSWAHACRPPICIVNRIIVDAVCLVDGFSQKWIDCDEKWKLNVKCEWMKEREKKLWINGFRKREKRLENIPIVTCEREAAQTSVVLDDVSRSSPSSSIPNIFLIHLSAVGTYLNLYMLRTPSCLLDGGNPYLMYASRCLSACTR